MFISEKKIKIKNLINFYEMLKFKLSKEETYKSRSTFGFARYDVGLRFMFAPVNFPSL